MTATISFELKGVMKHLSRDDRWNVLTALILHANIRNRAYPSMQTLADMTTGGNLHKATAAKKWLEKHGAFELVAYGKRVDDEKLCGKRQHIYQLLGVLRGCGDAECDCWGVGEYRYLYFSKQGKPEIVATDNITTGNDIAPVDNINTIEVVPVNNIKQGDIAPIDNVNGYKGSITSKTRNTNTHTKRTRKPSVDITPHRAAILELMRVDGYDPIMLRPEDLAQSQQQKYCDIAIELAGVKICAEEIPALFKSVKAIANSERWSVPVKSTTLAKHSGKFLQARAKARVVPIQPPVAAAPPSTTDETDTVDVAQKLAELNKQRKGA